MSKVHRSAWSRYKNSRLFAISVCPRDPLRGSAWPRCKNSRILRFLWCPRNPLRGSAWSRYKNSSCFVSFLRCADEPSAGIGVVEVQKLEDFAILAVSRCKNSRLFFVFLRCADEGPCLSIRSRCGAVRNRLRVSTNPLRRSCVSKRSRCGAVRFYYSQNGLWKLSCGLRACFRNRAVAGSIPPWSAAAPAQAKNRKIATLKRRRIARGAPPQLSSG